LYNLIRDRWIPVRCLDGSKKNIAPAQITENYASNCIVRLDTPRADFNGAMIQFLIGLVQTAMAPKSDRDWLRSLKDPPTIAVLEPVFEPFTSAFDLDGAGPRFMQDLELREGSETPIDRLLMESPGENTLDKNRDLFVKRDTVKTMCPMCAAMALYTLQTNAPGKGQGHRTSLRGGGPITTVITGRTLWEQVWFNILNEKDFLSAPFLMSKNDADKFPWLSATKTSDDDTTVGPSQVHPSQVYFGMPERIRLDSTTMKTSICDVCGLHDVPCYTQFLLHNHGVNYPGDIAWGHPLTPYRTKEKEHKTFAVHTDSGGIIYRHWLGLMFGVTSKDFRTEPSRSVKAFKNRKMIYESELPDGDIRIWSFGYKVKNSKAECWYESEMPFILVPNAIKDQYEMQIAQMIQTAEYSQSQLKFYCKAGMYRNPKAISGDFNFIGTVFWQSTEQGFYSTVSELVKTLTLHSNTVPLKLKWLSTLSQTSLTIFDRFAQSDTIADGDPKRIVVNRRKLWNSLSPKKDVVRDLLQLPETDAEDVPGAAQPRVTLP